MTGKNNCALNYVLFVTLALFWFPFKWAFLMSFWKKNMRKKTDVTDATDLLEFTWASYLSMEWDFSLSLQLVLQQLFHSLWSCSVLGPIIQWLRIGCKWNYIFTGPFAFSGLEEYLINSNSMNLNMYLTNYNLDDNTNCSSLSLLHFD